MERTNSHTKLLDGLCAKLQESWVFEKFCLIQVFWVAELHHGWLDLENIFVENSTDVEFTFFEKLIPRFCYDLDLIISGLKSFNYRLDYFILVS
jgi:hypothetical protein